MHDLAPAKMQHHVEPEKNLDGTIFIRVTWSVKHNLVMSIELDSQNAVE
jgi:hypothetical protein